MACQFVLKFPAREKESSLLSKEIPLHRKTVTESGLQQEHIIYHLMLIFPGGSRLPPVRAWKAPWLRSNIHANQVKIALEGSFLLTQMVLVTAGAGIRDSDGHLLTLAVVVLPSALVGDFDLAATICGRIAGSLPGWAYSGNVISILDRLSVEDYTRSVITPAITLAGWMEHLGCTHTPCI